MTELSLNIHVVTGCVDLEHLNRNALTRTNERWQRRFFSIANENIDGDRNGSALSSSSDVERVCLDNEDEQSHR
jgi:hypothetical protein